MKYLIFSRHILISVSRLAGIKVIILLMLFFATYGALNAQCFTAVGGQWPSSIYTSKCFGDNEEIVSSDTRYYSKVNLTGGITYTFSSSIATDLITIANDGGTVALAFGTTPVTYTPASNATIRFYIHTNDTCGTNFTSRKKLIICRNEAYDNVISPQVIPPAELGIVSSTCSTLLVKWQGNASQAQTYKVKATWFNSTTNKIDTAVGSNILCNTSQGCNATIPVIAGTVVTWSVQASAIVNGTAYKSYPSIHVLENPIADCTGDGLSFCGKALLQGAYDTSIKKMRNNLNSSGILQARASNQPYHTPGFGYTGTESVGAGFFAAHPDVVDWVLIEVRDPNIPSTVVGRRAAFVKQDGTLVDTNGISTQVFFPGLAKAPYHISIRHRNHLGIRTRTPIDFAGCGTACYDFTTAGFSVFRKQSYPSEVQVGTVWVMRGGDANEDGMARKTGSASVNDYSLLLHAVSTAPPPGPTGIYRAQDFNMDGNVRNTGTPTTNDYSRLLNMLGELTILIQSLF